MARRRCKVRRGNGIDSAPLMSSTEPPSGKRATARRIASISFCETCRGMVSSLWRNNKNRATKEYLCGAILLLRHFKWRASAILSSHLLYGGRELSCGEPRRLAQVTVLGGIHYDVTVDGYTWSLPKSVRGTASRCRCAALASMARTRYTAAREDQLKRHAFTPRRKARQQGGAIYRESVAVA